jgi:hypothetical protein
MPAYIRRSKNKVMNRKLFLKGASLTAATLLVSPQTIFASQDPEPYKMDMVKEFVIAGHGNIDKVKELLTGYPNLLFSRFDWGNGDFEEALEGAGHVGNVEIARYLISQGARPNIYVLAMLGETELVKTMVARYPPLLRGKGPHGFTLLHHARKGGDGAKELATWLEAQGLTELKFNIK